MNDPKSQPMFERCRDLEDKPDGPDRLSAIEASEIACKSARCALATGSLPVPSGLFFALASEWQRRIDDTQRVINNPEAQHRAGVLEINRLRTVNKVRRELLKELRAELAHATERQPESNVHMSQPGGPIPAEGQTEANTDGASSGLALGAGFGENDRAELAMLRELVGVRADAPACTADAQHWLKLMADRDIMIRQRALLEEINEALTEMGWHTDRGILQRVKTLLASSPNTQGLPRSDSDVGSSA